MASLVNACSASLINAGSIPMKGVVCAVAVGRLSVGPEPSPRAMVLDPSEAELPSLAAGGCFVFMFSSILTSSEESPDVPNASLLWTNYAAISGTIDDSEFSQAQEMALTGARQIWRSLKRSLSEPQGVSDQSRTQKVAADTILPRSSPEIDDAQMEI